MRIGIDASRVFVNERTGTENYSYQIINHLLALPEAKNHEWLLYTRKNIPLPYLWTQVGLAARTWWDNLDVLWIPAHTLPILRKPGLRTVVTIHGLEYEFLPQYETWLQRWYLPLSTRYAIASANKIIAVSDFTRQQIIQRLGADPKKITVVHEGVVPNLKFKILNFQSILEKYRLKKQNYVLFIGTVQPRKNLKRLIEAFLQLKAVNLKLVIAGKWGWNYADLPIDKYPNVIFTRYIDDQTRDSLLQNALAYVQPSLTEGFGLPVLEAMAAGVPVVSSSGGALSEVVGKAGLLFNPLDVQGIKSKLSAIIDSQQLQSLLIKRGYNRVKEFTWQKAAKETYNILVNN